MKVLFWGTPKYSLESLNGIIASSHEIVGAVTQPDRRRNRGKNLTYSPIKERCLELGIPIFTPNKIRENSHIKDNILALEADIYVVVAFGQILPPDILKKPIYGCWNSHASLLPKWRGAAPIQRSLLSGDNKTAVGIMFMEEGLDTGPLLMQEEIIISEFDNLYTLSERLSKLSARLLVKTLDLISNKNNIQLTPQNKLKYNTSYAKMITKEEYLIDWNNDSEYINRKIRALYPNTYSYWKGKRIKFIETLTINQLSEERLNEFSVINKLNEPNDPGTIIAILSDFAICISTSDKPLFLITAKLEGKSNSSHKSLIQQMKPFIGDQFRL